MKFTYSVIVVSNLCHDSTVIDHTGPSLLRALKEKYPNAQPNKRPIIVPEEKDRIVSTLRNLIEKNTNLILTAGGVGTSKRDVAPVATREVVERELPGIPRAIPAESLRGVAGVAKNSLIVNLPGSSDAASECLEFVHPVLHGAIRLLFNIKETQAGLPRDNIPVKRSKVEVEGVVKRRRTSLYPTVEFDRACEIVLEQSANHDDVEEIEIERSIGRVLGEDVHASEPFPAFRVSGKDGYAIRFEDSELHKFVKVVMATGDDPSKYVLQLGEVVRVSSGARIPKNAYGVVQMEDTSLVEADSKGNEVKIRINKLPSIGENICEIGSEIAANSIVFYRGETISAAHIGTLARRGHLIVNVLRRPSIALLSTGNELCPFKAKVVPPGHIRDSNKLTLANMLQKYRINIIDCGIVKKEPDLLKSALAAAFRKHDIVVTTGGVSMGESDLMKKVLRIDFNATIHFEMVNMQPGKPMIFATCRFEGSRKLIFALPGNPAAAMVTCRLFVIPAIHKFQNSGVNLYEKIRVETCVEDIKGGDALQFVAAQFEKGQKESTVYPRVQQMGNQISSSLTSCAGADVLIIVPKNYKPTSTWSNMEAYVL